MGIGRLAASRAGAADGYACRDMGVYGARAGTMERFSDLFARAGRAAGPFLIGLSC